MSLYSVIAVFSLAVRQDSWMTRKRDFIRSLLPGQVLDESLFLQKAMLRLVSNVQHNTEMQARVENVLGARPIHNRMFKGCGNVHDKQVTITWKPSLPRSHVCIAYFHYLPFLFWCNNKTETSVVYFQSYVLWRVVILPQMGAENVLFIDSAKSWMNSCHNFSVSEGDISCLTWKFKYLCYNRIIRISNRLLKNMTFKNMGMIVRITKYVGFLMKSRIE